MRIFLFLFTLVCWVSLCSPYWPKIHWVAMLPWSSMSPFPCLLNAGIKDLAHTWLAVVPQAVQDLSQCNPELLILLPQPQQCELLFELRPSWTLGKRSTNPSWLFFFKAHWIIHYPKVMPKPGMCHTCNPRYLGR